MSRFLQKALIKCTMDLKILFNMDTYFLCLDILQGEIRHLHPPTCLSSAEAQKAAIKHQSVTFPAINELD